MAKTKQTRISVAIGRLRELSKEMKRRVAKNQQEDKASPHVELTGSNVQVSPASSELASSPKNSHLLNSVVRERKVAQTLLDTIEALSSMPRPDEMPERILDELQRVVPYDAASISLLREEHFWTTASRGTRHTPSRRFALEELPLMQRVVNERGPVIIPDVRDEPDWSPSEELSSVRSWMGVPLLFKDKVVGVLVVNSHHLHVYDKEASRLALALAHQAAQAIESSRLYEQTQAQLREATLLHSVTTALSSTLDIDQTAFR